MSALTYGWSGAEEGRESFWIRFEKCVREPLGWKEELYAGARVIAARTKKPIWVCSSGGIDSEVICRAFKDQNIPFSVLSVAHAAGTNQYDISYAIRWCSENGVTHKIVPIDMPTFLTTDIDAYAEKYVAIHPFRYLQLRLMEIVEEMGGFAVLGSGEQIYTAPTSKKEILPDDLYLPLSNGVVMPLEWCKDHTTDHEPYFHFLTPELCLSYMQLPLIDFALHNPDPLFRHPANTYTLKRIAYQSVWPDMPTRVKAHGFGRIQDLYISSRDRLRDRFGAHYIPVDFPVHVFAKQLRGSDA